MKGSRDRFSKAYNAMTAVVSDLQLAGQITLAQSADDLRVDIADALFPEHAPHKSMEIW